MVQRELASSAIPTKSVSSQAVTTPVNGTVVDMLGFGYATWLADVGVSATAGMVVTFEESDVVTFGGEEVVIAGVNLTFSSTDDNKLFYGSMNMQKRKRFIRPVATGSGANIAVSCLKTNAKDTAFYVDTAGVAPVGLKFEV